MNSWFVLNVRPGISRPAYNDRFVSQERGRGYSLVCEVLMDQRTLLFFDFVFQI